MKKKLSERVPVSSYISWGDCNDDKIEDLAQRILGEDETAPMSVTGCRKIINDAIKGDREFLIYKHKHYTAMKGEDIEEIVRRIADLIDLMIPAAKGDSMFADPLLDLMDQMLEFLAEMNAELGPVPCGDGMQIGSLFNDTVSMETDLIKIYNTYPTLYELYLSDIKKTTK